MAKILKPNVERGAVQEAFARAGESGEPAWWPVPIFADDRGWSLMNLFQGVMTPQGQVNYSVMYPGVVKAWHLHEKQTDFWLCVGGHLKVGVYCDRTDRRWSVVMGEKHMGVLIIPPRLWHGACTVGEGSAGLVYYMTHAYDASAPDEQRRQWDSVEGFGWGVEHK